MAYSIAWNEAFPTSASAANLIWQYIQNKQIAVRERLDDIFGTAGGAQSIATADPYLPYRLTLKGTAASKIIPGSTSISLRDTADAEDNLIVLDNGNTTIRGALTVAKAGGGARVSVTGAASTTVDLSLGNSVALALNANITTLTLNNPVAGRYYLFEITQTGGFTITWPASVKWAFGIAPTLTATAGKTDIISFYYNGTNFLGVVAGLSYTL